MKERRHALVVAGCDQANHVPFRRLDLHDIRAQVAQQPAHIGPRHDPGEIQDPNAL
jgi:hypothetical protein